MLLDINKICGLLKKSDNAVPLLGPLQNSPSLLISMRGKLLRARSIICSWPSRIADLQLVHGTCWNHEPEQHPRSVQTPNYRTGSGIGVANSSAVATCLYSVAGTIYRGPREARRCDGKWALARDSRGGWNVPHAHGAHLSSH
jgi:hypothetical protein